MLSTSPNNATSSRSGFTLVEILIIAPILILTITGFVVLIITLTGDVMRTKGSSDAVYSTQEALDRIEDDARITTEFRATSYTTQAPQGITNTSFDDTGGATISSVTAGTPVKLIARTLTTNGNPMQETKSLIYKDPANSTCTTVTTLPYTADVVYFLKPDTANGTQSLWRRVVHGAPTPAGPDTAGYPCPNTVFQRRSCSPNFTNTAICNAEDVELVKNVSNLSVYYIDSAGNGLAGPSVDAVAVQVTIETTDTVAGRSSVNSGTLYSKRGNSPVDAFE